MLEDVYLNRYNYIWNRYLPKYHQSKSYQLGKILYRIKKETIKLIKPTANAYVISHHFSHHFCHFDWDNRRSLSAT